jgi:predicted O-methyltransferase YrrM
MDTFVQSVIHLQQTLPFVEGFTIPQQASQLEQFLKEHPELTTIGEIGFNVGMSSAVFLNVRERTRVISFDLGQWPYVGHQKALIDRLWPNRHTLLIGDSRQSVPQFHEIHPEPIFDFVFVDGGHQGDVPYKDVVNMLPLLKPGGIMCIDDVCDEPYAQTVVQTYNRLLEEKKVEHIIHYKSDPRGWVYCRKL